MSFHRIRSCLVVASLFVLASGCASPFGKSKTEGLPTSDAEAISKLKAKNAIVQQGPKKNVFQAAWDKASSPFKPKPKKAYDATSLSAKPVKINLEVHLTAARMLENTGRIEEAIGHYDKALKINPDHFVTLVSLARLHDRGGNFDEAVRVYERTIQAHPKKALAHNDLGLCYARQGKVNESLNHLSKAVELEPNKKKYRNNIATVLVESGRVPDAFNYLRSVHTESIARYNLAYLLKGRGQTQEAVKQLHLALDADGAFPEAKAMLAELGQPVPQSMETQYQVVDSQSPQTQAVSVPAAIEPPVADETGGAKLNLPYSDSDDLPRLLPPVVVER